MSSIGQDTLTFSEHLVLVLISAGFTHTHLRLIFAYVVFLSNKTPHPVFHQPSSHYIGVYYWHWIHTTTGGLLVMQCFTSLVVMISVLTWFNLYYCRNLLVPHWIIHPAISVSALTQLIRLFYYWTYSYLSQSRIGNLIYSLPNTFELCVFQ